MRTDAVGGQFAVALQLAIVQAPDAQHAATGVAGVILGAVQPLTVLVEYRVAIEVAVGRCVQGLQQTAVAAVDQVALSAGATADKQRQRLLWMDADVVAAAGHLGAE